MGKFTFNDVKIESSDFRVLPDTEAGFTPMTSIPCPNCEGKGYVLCGTCYNGVTLDQDGNEIDAPCFVCQGRIELLCEQCEGGGVMNASDELRHLLPWIFQGIAVPEPDSDAPILRILYSCAVCESLTFGPHIEGITVRTSQGPTFTATTEVAT